MDYSRIGERIKKYREKLKMTQQMLGEETDYSVQHISHIETGRGQLSLPTLVAIANVLCVDCNTLLGKTLTGAQDYLYREEIEQILSKMEPKKVQLSLQICRSIMEFES